MGRRSRELRSRRDARAALDELYARIPDVACRGLCFASCTSIEMSVVERDRIARAGVRILPLAEQDPARVGDDPCPALDADRRCTVYPVRPVICRLWGAVERLRCPHGCEPAGGWLSDEEAGALIREANAIGGLPAEQPELAATLARMMMHRDPGLALAISRAVRSGT
jgi:Fe-S-cluster containining protein